ncbi:MAG: efflux RND transporter periplasmic adaptor subunit, partial [Nocardioidaceae bacterium]
FPGADFQGVVARIASVFDPETNTTEAEVEIANADGRLKPGMFANVSIAFATEPGALLVPRAAVLEDQRESFLFVARQAPAREEGEAPGWTAKKVPVKRIGTGTDKMQDQVAVEGALQPGQQEINIGQQDLRDGAPVVLAREGSAPGSPPAGPRPAAESRQAEDRSNRRAL